MGFRAKRDIPLIFSCARRMGTFQACAFREQEDDQAALPTFLFLSPPHFPYSSSYPYESA